MKPNPIIDQLLSYWGDIVLEDPYFEGMEKYFSTEEMDKALDVQPHSLQMVETLLYILQRYRQLVLLKQEELGCRYALPIDAQCENCTATKSRCRNFNANLSNLRKLAFYSVLGMWNYDYEALYKDIIYPAFKKKK